MKELIKNLLYFPIGFIGVCKNRNKLIEINLNMINIDVFLYYLIILSLISFIISQYLSINVTYCDLGIDSDDIIELVSNNSNTQVKGDSSSVSDANCSTIFSSYNDRLRRSIFWYTCVKGKGSYNSYNDYKPSWNSNTKILDEINKELKNDINVIFHKINLNKRTFDWFFKPRKPGGGRGL